MRIGLNAAAPRGSLDMIRAWLVLMLLLSLDCIRARTLLGNLRRDIAG